MICDLYNVEDEDQQRGSDGNYEAFRELVTELSARNGVIIVGRAIHVCCGNIIGWQLLNSYACQDFLARKLGINAPVNYHVATLPIRNYISLMKWRKVLVPLSICINRRYEVNYCPEEDLLMLRQYDSTIGTENEAAEEMDDSSICVNGLSVSCVPMRVAFGGYTGMITDTIRDTLGDSTSLFMWVVGNAAMDVRNQDFFVILHGPSRSGKTSVMLWP